MPQRGAGIRASFRDCVGDNNNNARRSLQTLWPIKDAHPVRFSRLFGARADRHWSQGMKRAPCNFGMQGCVARSMTTIVAAGEIREGTGTAEEGAYPKLSTDLSRCLWKGLF
jgi:hypothetical protein